MLGVCFVAGVIVKMRVSQRDGTSASAAAPALRRAAMASVLSSFSILPLGLSALAFFIDFTRHSDCPQTQTVTRRKVAGMMVPPLLSLFCALASSRSWLWSSSSFLFFSAASKAFIVGP